MTNDTNEAKPHHVKALRELAEKIELQTTRIRMIEQQFLDLSARVNYIEDSAKK